MSGGPSAGQRRRREEEIYRGIRWRRSVGGTITWLNDNIGQWVTWYQGADAPPLPPAWEAGALAPGYPVKAPPPSAGPVVDRAAPGAAEPDGATAGIPPSSGPARTGTGPVARGQLGPPVPRASWRSPYRLVPIVIALAIIAVGIWQGTHPALTATPQQVAQAEALKGKCLAQTGGTASVPKLSATPVSCSSAQAAYRVVEVLVPGAKGQPKSCPAADAMVRVEPVAVAGEPVECVQPVRHTPVG